MVGWTRPHFPNDPSEEFIGSSGAGPYGDSVVELDARTGQVLDAIDAAGIKDNTIVIWLSDNGATVTSTVPEEIGGGDNGPFRGELGDAYEGSTRTAGMIRWPGKIKPGVSNEMISVSRKNPIAITCYPLLVTALSRFVGDNFVSIPSR
jgi:arylsulfatase